MCKAGTNKEPAAPAAGEDAMIHGTDPSQYKRPTTYNDDFYWVGTDEPHATRRKLIVEKYPQIKELFGHCPRTKYVVAFVVVLQTFLAYQAPFMSWPVFLATAYVIGGTSNHCMMMAMHELSHNLGFKKMLHNRICGLIANLPVLIPSAISFKRYHMEHHRYQGEEGIDVDLPTHLEGRIFNNVFSKTIFVIFQVLFYAFRPLYVNPKKPGVWELYNWIACLTYAAFIYAIAGYNGLGYLLVSSLMGSGAHPVAGHFIAEHYVFILGYETYSYYGILNFFTFNVGCHNEHHDFPYIPGSRLHKVREIAPEFYENLPKHDSWVKVIFDYITDPAIGAFSRVKRHTLTDAERNKLKSD
jgi:sphingolipid delta-4 desaturase